MLIYEVKSTVPVIQSGYYTDKDALFNQFKEWAGKKGGKVCYKNDEGSHSAVPLTLMVMTDEQGAPISYLDDYGKLHSPAMFIIPIYVKENGSITLHNTNMEDVKI